MPSFLTDLGLPARIETNPRDSLLDKYVQLISFYMCLQIFVFLCLYVWPFACVMYKKCGIKISCNNNYLGRIASKLVSLLPNEINYQMIFPSAYIMVTVFSWKK